MTAKTNGLYAPDGSLYVTVLPTPTNKSPGNQAPDGSIYITKAS